MKAKTFMKYWVGLLAGIVPAAAQSATVEFTYMPGGVSEDISYKGYGYGKKETYDMAIRICSPVYTGAEVTGFRVPVPVEPDWVKDVSGWMTSELKLENKKNAPDITVQPAHVENRMLVVEFDDPYVIPEEGVYIGYSLTVTELGDYSTHPLAFVEGDVADSFYVHTSRTKMKWTDEAAGGGYVSAMIVTLRTESGDYDAAATLPPVSYMVENEIGETQVSVVNYGMESLSEIGYSWNAAGLSGNGSKTLAVPIEPGATGVVGLPLGPLPEKGRYGLEIALDTFNGNANMDPRRVSSSEICVMPFMPEKKPLVEEYTGLKCQYCPRGYVAMERMSEDYGERFVGLAYHTETFETGCMVVMPNSDFPVSVSGYPYGTIDRNKGMDPSEIPAVWTEYASLMAPADLDVELDWEDDAHTVLRATVTADFAMEFDEADMALSLAIAADGLKNDSWKQTNAFAGAEGYDDPLWEIFTKGGRSVSGLTFNDVVVYYEDVRGDGFVLPSQITFDTHPEYSFTLNVADIKNIKGQDFLNPECTLKAVGMLIDRKTGDVLNSGKSLSLPLDVSGVEDILVRDETGSVEWYDMQGRRMRGPVEGMPMIRVARYADGKVVTSKVAGI